MEKIPDNLLPDEIGRGLKTRWMGRPVFCYEELDSTNDAAFKLGEEGLKEGACVLAEYQRKGRGRLGRSWDSAKGKNVLLSVLLRPPLDPAHVSKVTLTAAVSAAKTLRKATGKDLGIKWPNDIIFQGRKLCGILTEMSAELDRVHFVVVGIGINVNSNPRELPPGASSLMEAAGKKMARVELVKNFLHVFEGDYERLKRGDFASIAGEWEEFSVTSGRIVVSLLDRKIEGEALGIDEEGALWIRKDNGLQERVFSGEVLRCR
ncbi:MAG: biotin--[acetyl-CoA-carboxylase] ligase [Candidatus Omnitrophica bacterium]|nr:biotin--[acetyl-CoA-carboxylase] ligase [Candidatus Omnitrophota bacterium]